MTASHGEYEFAKKTCQAPLISLIYVGTRV